MDSAQIDPIIDKHRGKPGDLIHVLMEIQHENHWLPRDVLQQGGRRAGDPVQPGAAHRHACTRPSA